jgi:hypothetical protein
MSSVTEKFEAMGARVKLRDRQMLRGRSAFVDRRGLRVDSVPPVEIDVRKDKEGEYFDLLISPGAKLHVVDLRKDLRHLLLMSGEGKEKAKFLCGHDERHWFTAAVPEKAGATSVLRAMDALKPREVREAETRQGVVGNDRYRRHNKGSLRQGEWFFVPAPDVKVPKNRVLRNEPLMRGPGSKPHNCEFLYRTGGRQVWVGSVAKLGSFLRERVVLDLKEYDALSMEDRKAGNFRGMVENPTVYVKGRVWHSDHKTIILQDWHRVYMNTEREARSARQVRFLD